jgi:hypothetical protein
MRPPASTRITAAPQTVESLGQHLRFVALKVDHLGDEHRALDMRRQEPHPAPRSFIDNAVPRVAEDAEHRGFPCRPFQGDADEIDQALRFSPFAIEAGLQELLVRNEVARRDWLVGIGKEAGDRDWIERDVFAEIELPVPGRDAVIVEMDVALIARGVLPENGRGGAWDEQRDFFQYVRPDSPIQHGVVDGADNLHHVMRAARREVLGDSCHVDSKTERPCGWFPRRQARASRRQ